MHAISSQENARKMARPTINAAYHTVRVQVTDELIASATPRNSSHCMIADAIQAAVPQAKQIAVDLATIRFTDPDKNMRYIFLTPRSAQTALLLFDQGLPVDTFDFVLRTAAQVVRTGKAYRTTGGRKQEGIATTTNSKIPTRLGGQAPGTAVLSNRGNARGFGLRRATP